MYKGTISDVDGPPSVTTVRTHTRISSTPPFNRRAGRGVLDSLPSACWGFLLPPSLRPLRLFLLRVTCSRRERSDITFRRVKVPEKSQGVN